MHVSIRHQEKDTCYIALCFHCDLGASLRRRITSKVHFRDRLDCIQGICILPYWCNAIALPSLHNRAVSADALRLCKLSVFISRDFIPFHLSSLISSFFDFSRSLSVFSSLISCLSLQELDLDNLEFRNSIERFKAHLSFVSRYYSVGYVWRKKIIYIIIYILNKIHKKVCRMLIEMNKIK